MESNNYKIDYGRCVKCYACIVACMDQNDINPGDEEFDLKIAVPLSEKLRKCDGCSARIQNRLIPACIRICPTKALT